MGRRKRKQKNKAVRIVFFLIFLVCLVVFTYLYKDEIVLYLNSYLPPLEDKTEGNDEPTIVVSDELQIHFLELGNKNAGDFTYIKAGDIDILIDAGSTKTSSKTIEEYVDKYCTGGILEYVIATHAHEDHIAAFVDSSSNPGIFSYYEVKTIIDFTMKNTTSKIADEYIEARNKEVSLGAK